MRETPDQVPTSYLGLYALIPEILIRIPPFPFRLKYQNPNKLPVRWQTHMR